MGIQTLCSFEIRFRGASSESWGRSARRRRWRSRRPFFTGREQRRRFESTLFPHVLLPKLFFRKLVFLEMMERECCRLTL